MMGPLIVWRRDECSLTPLLQSSRQIRKDSCEIFYNEYMGCTDTLNTRVRWILLVFIDKDSSILRTRAEADSIRTYNPHFERDIATELETVSGFSCPYKILGEKLLRIETQGLPFERGIVHILGIRVPRPDCECASKELLIRHMRELLLCLRARLEELW